MSPRRGMGLGVGWGPKCAFYSLGRTGRRAGQSHIVPKGQSTEMDSVYRHDLIRSHANNDKTKKP